MIKLRRPSYASARAPGFTLIELAIVLAIVGLLASGFLNARATHLVQQRINTTQSNADSIKTTLLNFHLTKQPATVSGDRRLGSGRRRIRSGGCNTRGLYRDDDYWRRTEHRRARHRAVALAWDGQRCRLRWL